MNTTTQLPTTQNEDWGFWGTMEQHADRLANQAWPLALQAVAQATDTTLDAARMFLDSRHGRHFADDVRNRIDAGDALTDAVHATTAQWMAWRISRQTTKEYGIPRGLPYLTGFVMHCEITEELTA